MWPSLVTVNIFNIKPRDFEKLYMEALYSVIANIYRDLKHSNFLILGPLITLIKILILELNGGLVTTNSVWKSTKQLGNELLRSRVCVCVWASVRVHICGWAPPLAHM